MLAFHAGSHIDDGVRYLEASVTPSNEASSRMFRGFARAFDAPCNETNLFRADQFPKGEAHEEERLLRIGPFDEAATRRLRELALAVPGGV